MSSSSLSPQHKDDIHKELTFNKQEMDRMVNNIKAGNPFYYQSFLDTGFINLENVRYTILKDHQALVEMFTGDSTVYSMIITKDQVKINRIDKADYDSTVHSYINYISNPSLLNMEFASFVKSSSHLYELIFQKNVLPRGRIIISPDGQYFPFEALVTNSNNQSPTYFLNDYAVSYTYSARYLTNSFKTSTVNASGFLLGMAPIQYPEKFRLASLNGSDHSLNQIQSYFSNTDILLSVNASRHNFMKNFSKYKIVQLYTHASDSGDTGEPVIYFADSVLYLSDLIAENKPLTSLIVLSACRTGNGVMYQGEGVFSFNRGFAALGIPASIANLWEVESRSTYSITELFYKNIAQGLSPDIALQKAKKEFLSTANKEKSLPYYWAAPILAGKTNSIEYDKNTSWMAWLLFGLFALIAGWGIIKWAKK